MASKQCHFRKICLQEPEFDAWLQQTKDDSNGYCKLCRKVFDISNKVIGAVNSRMKSKQHNQIMKHKQSPFTQPITDFSGKTPTNLVNKFHPLVSPEQTSDVLIVLVSSPSTSYQRKCCMQKFLGLLK